MPNMVFLKFTPNQLTETEQPASDGGAKFTGGPLRGWQWPVGLP